MRGLLAMGAEPAKAAVHAQLGRLVGDQTAIGVLERAGRTALAVGALDGAVKCLAAAVELAGHLAAPTLLLELAQAEVATGRTEGVKEACDRALELAPGTDGRLDALVMRARVAFSVNDDEAPYWTEAVRAAEGSEKLVGVLAEAVITMSKVVGPAAVAPWAARLRVLRGQVPPPLRTEVDIAWGAVAGMAGQVEGTEAVRAALGPANLASVMGSASPMLFPRMLALAIDSRYLVECFDEADGLVATAWELAERRGAVMTLTYLALLRAMGNCWRGRLAGAHEALGDLAGIQAAAGLRETKEHWAGVLAMLALEEGHESTALVWSGEGRAPCLGPELRGPAWALAAPGRTGARRRAHRRSGEAGQRNSRPLPTARHTASRAGSRGRTRPWWRSCALVCGVKRRHWWNTWTW